MGKAIRKTNFGSRMGNISRLGMPVCESTIRIVLSVYVDDMTLAGKKQNIDPMRKVLMKHVDLGEPTSFHDHVYLGALNVNAKRAKILLRNTRFLLVLQISAGATERLLSWRNLTRILSLGLVTWRSVEDMCGNVLRVG